MPSVTPHKRPSETLPQALRNVTEEACPQPGSKKAQHIEKTQFIITCCFPFCYRYRCSHVHASGHECVTAVTSPAIYCPGTESSALQHVGLTGFMAKESIWNCKVVGFGKSNPVLQSSAPLQVSHRRCRK